MTTIKAATREDLRGKHLTRVHGRQPNANNVETWEEQAAKIASTIKVKIRFIQGGKLMDYLPSLSQKMNTDWRSRMKILKTKNPNDLNHTIQISREMKTSMNVKYWRQNIVRSRMTTNAIWVCGTILYKNSSIPWMQNGWHH